MNPTLLSSRSTVINLAVAAACIGFMSEVRAQGTAEQRKACTPDALKFCSDEIPDVDRVKACMQTNRGKLSPACQAVFPAGDSAEAAPRQRGPYDADAQDRAARALTSDPALSIARQVITGIGQACENQTMPREVCSAYGQFLGSVGQ